MSLHSTDVFGEFECILSSYNMNWIVTIVKNCCKANILSKISVRFFFCVAVNWKSNILSSFSLISIRPWQFVCFSFYYCHRHLLLPFVHITCSMQWSYVAVFDSMLFAYSSLFLFVLGILGLLRTKCTLVQKYAHSFYCSHWTKWFIFYWKNFSMRHFTIVPHRIRSVILSGINYFSFSLGTIDMCDASTAQSSLFSLNIFTEECVSSRFCWELYILLWFVRTHMFIGFIGCMRACECVNVCIIVIDIVHS